MHTVNQNQSTGSGYVLAEEYSKKRDQLRNKNVTIHVFTQITTLS